jgi:hypothetical protein
MTRERVLSEHALRLRCQTVEPFAHVGDARRQPYPRARRQPDHRSNSITCRSVSGETSPRTHDRAPHAKAISIAPLRRTRSERRASLGSDDLDGSMVTLPMLAASAGNSSAAISRRHLKTSLAVTSWRRAMIETDAPGSSVSATIRRFNASGHSRRFSLPEPRLAPANAEMDTSFAVAAMPHHRAN